MGAAAIVHEPKSLQYATASGLVKVEIVGPGGNQQIYQDMSAGKVLTLTPTDLYALDYFMLDALARQFADQRPDLPGHRGLQGAVGQDLGQEQLTSPFVVAAGQRAGRHVRPAR
jgi:hypothetical protein